MPDKQLVIIIFFLVFPKFIMMMKKNRKCSNALINNNNNDGKDLLRILVFISQKKKLLMYSVCVGVCGQCLFINIAHDIAEDVIQDDLTLHIQNFPFFYHHFLIFLLAEWLFFYIYRVQFFILLLRPSTKFCIIKFSRIFFFLIQM